jgi:hypothetical protein
MLPVAERQALVAVIAEQPLARQVGDKRCLRGRQHNDGI